MTTRKHTDDRFNPNGPTYCVPFAIAEATGLSYTAVEDLIREHRGQDPSAKVAGVNASHWTSILRDLLPGAELFTCERKQWTANFSDHDEFCDLGPTLAAWHRNLSPTERNRTLVIRIRSHVMLVRGDLYCDQQYTRGAWVPLEDHPKRRQRVDFYMVLPEDADDNEQAA